MSTQTNENSKQSTNYLEKLTPENSLLVLVDYLTGFIPGIKTIAPDVYQNNVSALARIGEIFKDRMPTLVLGDEGGFRGKFFDQINEFLPDAPRVARNTPSAWHAEEFRRRLDESGRRKIIMAGISIDNCVTQTALDVLRAGYEVYILPDVSGSDHLLAEQAAISRLVQAGAVMTNWVSLASELMDGWAKPEGRQIGELYQKYSAWGETGDAKNQTANG
ncbi:MAG: isochorismatase family protein [Acidobacteriota bacterium]|nr:isochorismatase family protein [Acidobacteriota bacterium]